MTKEFLESVEENARCKRPEWRVNDAKADTQCDSALLLSDLSQFPYSKCLLLYDIIVYFVNASF